MTWLRCEDARHLCPDGFGPLRRARVGYAGGYGVGVDASIAAAYFRSISVRIARRGIPLSSIRITSRVTPRQTPQVGAMESKTTLPSRLTALT